jgi:hypothetical protein
MTAIRLLKGLLFHLPLLGAAAYFSAQPDRAVSSAYPLALLAAYARLAALVSGASGPEERRFFVQALPYFALFAASLGRLGALDTLLSCAAASAVAAALLSVEALLVKGPGNFAAALAFVAAASVAAFAASTLPVVATIGGSLSIAFLASYIARRRL